MNKKQTAVKGIFTNAVNLILATVMVIFIDSRNIWPLGFIIAVFSAGMLGKCIADFQNAGGDIKNV